MTAFKLRLRHLCFALVLSSIAISCCRGQGGGGGAGGGGAGGGGAGAGGGAVVPGTQDAIQIVAQAALCFDNRQVINGCLQSMGINVNGNGNSNGNGAASSAAPPAPSSSITGSPAPAPGPSAANNGSTASMCQGPCFGQMMLMMNCVNGILGNIQGYSPGLMQGVQAVFQMACGNTGNGQGGGGAGGAGGGGAGGGGAGSGGAGAGAAASGGGAGSGGAGAGGGMSGGGGGTGGGGGSQVAVSNLDELTSSADGPTGGFPSTTLIAWTCIWLLLV